MAQSKKHLHLARARYDDIDTAVKELGSLWVLALINKTLTHTTMKREENRLRRGRDTKE